MTAGSAAPSSRPAIGPAASIPRPTTTPTIGRTIGVRSTPTATAILAPTNIGRHRPERRSTATTTGGSTPTNGCGGRTKRPAPDLGGDGQANADAGADADCAAQVEGAAVALDDVLDDGEAKAGAAGFAAARRIDAVEALGHSRQMLARDSGPVVG